MVAIAMVLSESWRRLPEMRTILVMLLSLVFREYGEQGSSPSCNADSLIVDTGCVNKTGNILHPESVALSQMQ
ncbi:hypothetical protein GCM10009548_05590 [Streptomyces malaysiensis subsp. malaysiensis]